ncbi:MAG: polysaccharide deacetylase family protein [Candidatus Shapirobacteria bacterium]|jgi:peptidoglycan/xylan/chitin deacetylase (PgdA/CDA1 family)
MSHIKLNFIKICFLLITALLLRFGFSEHALAQTGNLIANPSVETASSTGTTPQDWFTDKWGTNTAVFSYPAMGYLSDRAVKVQLTSRSSGDAKWYFKEIPATANTNYTFSDYYQSNVASVIVVATKLTTGSYNYLTVANLVAAPAWTKANVTFKTPANTSTVTVYHLINKVGWLITDEFSLISTVSVTPTPTPTLAPTLTPTSTPTSTPTITSTPTPIVTIIPTNTPTPTATAVPTSTSTPIPTATIAPTNTPTPTPTPVTNPVLNPSLEQNRPTNTNLPINWTKEKWGSSNTTFTYLKTSGHTGTRSIKVQTTRYTSGDAKWTFDPVAVTPGESYYFSDWYQSNIVTHLVVRFTLANGSYSYLGLRDAPISAAWAEYKEAFTVPVGVKALSVLHFIDRVGWLITDDYSLQKFTSSGYGLPLVSLTFDDGWEDNTLTAMPLLKQNQIPVTYYFATTFLVNSPATGAINVSGPSAVNYIYSEGHEIGSHSVTHPDLTTLTSAQIIAEITDSKNYLENLVGVGKVTSFATPFGAYNDTVITSLKSSLYRSHRTTDEGPNTPENYDRYRLKVQNLQSTTTLSEFQSWVDQAVADKSWLILVYHRIASSDLTQYDTSLTDFNNHLSYLKQSGVVFKTVSQAIDSIENVVPTVTTTIAPTSTNTPIPTSTSIPTATPTSIITPTPTTDPAPTSTPLPVYPTPTYFPQPTAGPNLILNNSLEIGDTLNSSLPDKWQKNNWGTNTTVFTYPVPAIDGSAAAKTEITSFTDGDGKWYFSDVAVTPNTVYQFSDQYQSNISSRITVRYFHDDGTYTYVDIGNVVASADWSTFTGEITIPTDVHSITVFHLIESIGWIITDNYSLRQKAAPIPFSQGMVSLTFDDGWLSVYQNAIPALNAAGFKSTQYITTSFLGTTDYMSVDNVLAMQISGHEIASHSLSHLQLPTLNESQIRQEVSDSRVTLLGMGFSLVKSFAYPYGEYNDLILRITKESGYTTARTAVPFDSGYNYKHTDPFMLKNFSVEVDTTLDQVKTWIDTANQNKTWSILVFHQVDTSGGQYSISPTLLQGIVDYLTQTGTSVVTVSQGLGQMLN